MRFYLDLTSRKLVYGPGNNLPITTQFALTRGDQPTFELQFMQDGTVVDNGAESVFFCLKEVGDNDGDALALGTSFTKSGSGETTLWSGEVNLDTTELDTLLGVGDPPDVTSISVSGEFGFVIDGKQTTSRLLSVLIENDLYRGDESAPTPATPDYPSAPEANKVLGGNSDGTAWMFTPATATPSADSIVIAGGDGKVDADWLPASVLITPGSPAAGNLLVFADPDWALVTLGTDGQVLTLADGLPVWSDATGGFSNPMTAAGDVIVGGVAGAPSRLAKGTDGQILTLAAGTPGWADAPVSGFTNPMTTAGDVIVGGALGVADRLAAGTDGQVLKMVSGAPAWGADSGAPGADGAGYAATSTTSLVTAGSGSKAFTTQTGLAYSIGARIRATSTGTSDWMEGVVTDYTTDTLTVTMDLNSGTGTNADWTINLAGERGSAGADGGGMTNPMTTAADLIVGGSTGTPDRLGVGSDGQVLTVTGGAVTWEDPTGGLSNPMIAAGDLIIGGTSGDPDRLPAGSDGQVLKIVSGAPAWGTDETGTGSLPATPAEGDTTFFDGTNWVSLGIGTAAQVLTVNPGETAPEWADPTGGSGAPTDATYIVQTASGGLSAEQALGALTTGILKSTTTTGVLSIAVAGTDFVAPGAATGSGLTMATARLLGRTTASAGAVEEITVGSGLSLASGTLTATGGSGTKTLARFRASENQPPASAFATLDTRNSIVLLNFDDTTAENAVFASIIPEGADFTTGVTVKLHWLGATATSGNVVWTIAFEKSNTDLDSDSFATGLNSSADAANGTSGIETVTSVDFDGTQIDGMAAGDLFRLKITRKAADSSDTMTGDAQLLAVEVRQR